MINTEIKQIISSVLSIKNVHSVEVSTNRDKALSVRVVRRSSFLENFSSAPKRPTNSVKVVKRKRSATTKKGIKVAKISADGVKLHTYRKLTAAAKANHVDISTISKSLKTGTPIKKLKGITFIKA